MNRGVQMLIARTKSNPEEFDCFDTNKKKGRWNWVIDAVYDRTIRWDVSRGPMIVTKEEVGSFVVVLNNRAVGA
jgi:hypothetical protein